ncbi:putative protease YhbU [Sinobacterium norvegicum]|uniref:Ubiquinone biosynthesis protein UbiU n=1 Tax=Sinobacterium norvegicum TaxID=1641715 RepID=A0ABM9AJ13_9GAMM|nr:peptidase U32 family protein [Sinobacterium norvegicum]CAH0992777.1 putative protease YhbU [Sinobacterium norvegicum]
MELLCPAGNLPALKTAINNGADAVYIGFKDQTNARNFAGLNFSDKALVKAADYCHQRGKKLHIAINTFAHPGNMPWWQRAVDKAAEIGADALIIADMAVLEYAFTHYPNIERHLSVQASVTNVAAIALYHRLYRLSRVVLPRVLSLQHVEKLAQISPVPLEVFAFGSLCIMAEGRCFLSSYVTGESPNTTGACSPAKFVEWKEHGPQRETYLNKVMIDRFEHGEKAGYPTLCKGRFEVNGDTYHALEEPTSLSTLDLIDKLIDAGVVSVKIEGRQRSPAYVEQITSVWRQAIDKALTSPEHYASEPQWRDTLAKLSEGSQTTLGAYHRSWK